MNNTKTTLEIFFNNIKPISNLQKIEVRNQIQVIGF